MHRISIPKGARAVLLNLRYETMRHMWLADVSETVCLGKNQKIGISVPLLHRTKLRN